MKQFGLWLLVLGMVVLAGCGTTSSISSQSSANTKLTQIADTMIPKPLQTTQGISAAKVRISSTDPLAVFLNGQPMFLKGYLMTSQMSLEAVVTILDAIEKQINLNSTVGNGQISVSANTTVDYAISSPTQFMITMRISGIPAFRLSLDGSSIGVIVNMDQMNAMAGPTHIGWLKADITYTDATHWTNTMLITGISDPVDANIPERMKIIVENQNGLFKGKAMSYHPYATEPSPSSPHKVVYSDFVSDQTAAKMSIYFMNGTVTDISNIATYALGNIGVNYPEYASQAASYYQSVFPNPVAISATGAMSWGDDASGLSSAVGAAAYLDASLWVVPNTLVTGTTVGF